MSASNATPIAIIGVGCRFPGGVESAAGLWELLVQGRDTVGPVPPDRWNAAALTTVHDPDEAARAGRGCFLDGDVWAWDPQAFAVAPVEARWVDPQFRVLLETAWEAVEHAGIPIDRLRGSRTGVYVGTYAPDNLFREIRPVEDAPNSPYLFGNFTAGAAGRVAFAMDLRGPVMVVSTHCSSGLVAVDTACGALTLGECDTALAGGVLLMLSPQTQFLEAPLLLSQHGACHAFDARADGYVRGEGAGVLVLKRLTDALRDGDRVLAVIRGSAVNNDGQASRLTAPSTQMQQDLFRQAVVNAGIDPGDVGLVEAHGPGTAVGDPVEFSSINAVYGQGRGRCALGSIKTNIGHSEPVSGIAGAIKAVQCLRHHMIPPNLHFTRWNPSIARGEGSRLFVPVDLTAWPVPDVPGLATVCSYGVTGTNAHLVLEAAPVRSARRGTGSVARLFPLSGHSPESLTAAASRLASWVGGAGAGTGLADVAHTLAVRRSHADHRVGIVARDHRELVARATAFAASEVSAGVAPGTSILPPGHAGPVLVFTGQGSQRAGMCQGILAAEPTFGAVIDQLEPLIHAEAGFSVREMIIHPERLAGLARIQPTLFAIQVALAAVWRSWGIQPAAVIGQSLGEVAACVVAGGLGPADGARLICRRSALLATISGGAMASVLLGAEDVRAAIAGAGADGVSLAVLTSPGTTVISGDAHQIATLVEQWAKGGVVARMIEVDVASHSPQVDPILDQLHTALGEIPAARPGIAFYSTVRDDPRASQPLDGAYWVRNQRDPVRFHAAVAAALADGHRLFLECTAHPLAVRPILEIAQHGGIRDAVAVGTLREGTDDLDAFLGHLGSVHAAGHEGIDWATQYGDGDLAEVPGTAWHRIRHGGDTQPYRLVAPHLVGAGQHPLLGGHVQDPDRPGRHWWQTPIGPARLPWLADHQVAGVPVLAGTGFVEMMLAAATQVFGTGRVAVTDITVAAPLVLEPEPTVTTRLDLDRAVPTVEILSHTPDGTTVHARATVRPLAAHDDAEPLDSEPLSAPEWVDSEPADLYRHFRHRHDVCHGPAFTAVERIRIHPDEDRAVSTVRIAEAARVSAAVMTLHPALLDEMVQTVVSVWLAHYVTSPGPVVVAGFDEVRVYGPPVAHTRIAAVRLHQADDSTSLSSGQLATADGTVVAEVRGLRLTNITPPAERFAARLSHLAFEPETVDRAGPATAADRQWLVLAHHDVGWPADLARVLKERTAGCQVMATNGDAALASVIPTQCGGVALAVDAVPRSADPALTAREEIARTVTVIQHLAALPHPPRLWLLRRTEPDTPPIPSGMRGLLRVAAYEHPDLTPSSIEFDTDTTLDAVIDDLMDPALPITEIFWRHGHRHLARIRSGAGMDAPIPVAPASPVRPGGAYLVTGGLGGLGLCTVRWLATHGAGRVVISSRSAPTRQAAVHLDSLRDGGTQIVHVTGDIADPAVTASAVTAATADGLTLRGVVHAAGVVQDATLGTLEESLLARVWRGKADGAWALHQETLRHDLDFFVLYSSVASLIGSPGQAAYAAANAFLDTLTDHRLARGLPATSIYWGAWNTVGRGQHLAERGFLTITPADGIDALCRILDAGYHHIAYSPIDLDRWTAAYPALRDSTLVRGLLTDGRDDEPTDAAVLAELRSATSHAARQTILESFIIDRVRDLLGGTTRHIGPHTSMVILGLDSLGAVQLQQQLQRALKVDIKPGVIWVKPHAAALADWLLDRLGLHHGPRSASDTPVAAAQPAPEPDHAAPAVLASSAGQPGH